MKQFIVSSKPDLRGVIKLENKDYKYLVTVRRIKEGNRINLRIAGDISVSAEVLGINTEKKYVELKVLQEEKKLSLKMPCLVLMQWVLKGQHMDLAVRQAAETGIAAVFPVLGDFSVIKAENKNQTERRRRIIREARQQSGSSTGTEIFPAQKLEDALKAICSYTAEKKSVYLMLTEQDKAEKNIFQTLSQEPEAAVLAIGAEGGISGKEELILKQRGFCKVHFNTNILRAETAAIYSIAVVQTLLTEGKKWQLSE